jgi:hypothetical protein
LKTPLAAWLDGGSKSLSQAVEERVILPLKQAEDELAWTERMEEVVGPWMELRIVLTAAAIRGFGPQKFESASRAIADLPLTLLPEPAHGAALFSLEVVAWLIARTFAALRGGAPIDADVLAACVHDLAVIELCWFTLIGPERPVPSVAEAAAWEAYSRALPLRALLLRVGVPRDGMPVETPEEATARGLALLERVSSSWTDADTAAVEAARLPDVLSQA